MTATAPRTARRALSCRRCGFSTATQHHLSSCVPTSQWPRELRERKRNAMRQVGPLCQCGTPESEHPYHDGTGWHFAVAADAPERLAEQVKPMGLAEYRRLHPEANPFTAERLTIREFRQREDGTEAEWERPLGIREVIDRSTPCPRCHRPMLDRGMHVTCKPVDGSLPPERHADNRLKRDDVPLTPRQPVIHTQDEVVSGAGWFERAPVETDDETDADELSDYLSEFEQPEPSALRARLVEAAEAEHARRMAVSEATVAPAATVLADVDDGGTATASEAAFACPTCGRVSKSLTGSKSHQRSHRAAD